MRTTLLALACTAALAGHGDVMADWPPEGVPLCSNCDAGGLLICPDGVGGAYVAWARFNGIDISLQRVTAAGEIAVGWPAEGVPICTDPAAQLLTSLTPDGHGGVLLAWFDYRNSGPGGTTGIDIYVQRVQGDGTLAPGWAVNGMPATRAPGRQTYPVVLADGTGGAFIGWEDETLADIYVQHLTPGGAAAPGWPINGLAVSVDPAEQLATQLVTDGAGGLILTWADFRDGPFAVYGQHLLADGAPAPGWPVNGLQIVPNVAIRQMISDGAGGAFVTSATLVQDGDDDYFLQRFSGSGAIAPGWPASGAPVCQAPSYRQGIRMVPDGVGGAVLAWSDNRESISDDEIFMVRMQGDGTRASGWPLDGLQVTDNIIGDISPDLAADELGGAYVCWDRYFGPSVGDRTVLQHINGNGLRYPGWPVDGLVIPSDSQTGGAQIAPDGMGGAIVAWLRLQDHSVRALRLTPDGPVAIQVSLQSAEASPDRVRLVWLAVDARSLRADVERQTEGGEWQTLSSVASDGTGRLVYEDRDVIPGARYAYRLAYVEQGVQQSTAETWVTVPRLELALEGFRPNPSAGVPCVAFALAEGTPATLEVYDVAGRRVMSREVGSLGPGWHVAALQGEGRLGAGVYAIRLVQGERVLRARGVVVR